MKRFWKTVTIVGGAIELDGRPVRTPDRAPLILPTPQLAEAVAEEWRSVGEELDPRAMPLTGLTNAAIDQIAPNPAPFAADLARYGESDLLCYRAELPEPLVERQAAQWDPLLDWARTRYDVHFETTAGIMHRPQPPATIARLNEVVAALDPFRLAALSPLVTISGSLVAALALLEGAADRETIWRAAQLDENWQAEQWGEDELATRARNVRRADFDAAARFLSLL
ncbi:ATPase [Sphingomonas sp. ABOLD]|uniref:Chaperone required for assembly of F1-ATPase n=1 Tax=Sphingomonas trueperi TaxID=53317 RepID=A0A7X5XW52_9SPHN|nr:MULTISPECIES: ATP12 family protein [Sphingomonas]NJB96472.1 chaperone required for assembly of F1-ATPase [Sphingomonas trueperi]RSV39804.1 ATPase [Sphingomonas sp. ABOLE]RSV50201.1 ATPase [Sphingomonas sp. ABOLD]